MSEQTNSPEEYHGWRNVQTWLVSLWLGDDEDNYKAVQSIIGEVDRTTENRVYWVGARVRDFVERNNPLLDAPASLYQDFIREMINTVDWYEIAKSLIDEVNDE